MYDIDIAAICAQSISYITLPPQCYLFLNLNKVLKHDSVAFVCICPSVGCMILILQLFVHSRSHTLPDDMDNLEKNDYDISSGHS